MWEDGSVDLMEYPLMKRFFEKELHVLKNHLTEVGHKSIEQVRLAISALENGDTELAAWIRTQDDEIDRLEMEIDAEAIRYISLRAPVAKELRMVVMAMNVGHEIERVGDEACNIAKRVQKLAHHLPGIPLPEDILVMGKMVDEMLEEAMEALLEGDAEKAISVCHRDPEVDKIHKRFNRAMTQRTIDDSSIAPIAIELLFVARSIERIGDHATNLAEEVVYIQRGEDIRHKPLVKDGEVSA